MNRFLVKLNGYCSSHLRKGNFFRPVFSNIHVVKKKNYCYYQGVLALSPSWDNPRTFFGLYVSIWFCLMCLYLCLSVCLVCMSTLRLSICLLSVCFLPDCMLSPVQLTIYTLLAVSLQHVYLLSLLYSAICLFPDNCVLFSIYYLFTHCRLSVVCMLSFCCMFTCYLLSV